MTASRFDAFLVHTLGLTKLPTHLPAFATAFCAFLFVHQLVAPRLTPASVQGRAARNNWSIHVVSQLHTLLVVPLALRAIAREGPERGSHRAFGWDADAGFVHAIACGYFLWDTLDAVVNFTDPGFVAHGLVCLMIYTMSYKPLFAYYGVRCLLWETSTLFLNIHWFLDKTNRTGTLVQLVNGIFLLLSFFGVRIVYGGQVSYEFFRTLAQIRQEIPLVYLVVYSAGNLTLQVLNWFWFYKMTAALRKRFANMERGGQKKLAAGNGIAANNEFRVNGTTHAHVD